MLSAPQPYPLLADDGIRQRLTQYVEQLTAWNKSINLIAASTEATIWQRHIEDSAQLFQYIPKHAANLTDFGSGAGLPVMVLAILAQHQLPQLQLHAIESIRKKNLFMAHCVRELGLTNLTLHHARCESLAPWQSDVITARAFAPLPELLTLTHPFAAKEHLFLLHKGCTSEAEISAAHNAGWKFDLTTHPSHTAEGVILALQNVKTPKRELT